MLESFSMNDMTITPRSLLRPATRVVILFALAVVVSFEGNPGNASRALAQRGASVRVAVDTPTAFVGDTVRTSIDVNDVDDLAGYQLTLAWDTTHLRDVEIRVDEEYITSTGRRIDFLDPVWGDDRVTFLLFTTPPTGAPVPGVSGSGALIYADFEALAPGVANIELIEVLLTDTENTPIETSLEAGSVSIEDSRPIFMPIAFNG